MSDRIVGTNAARPGEMMAKTNLLIVGAGFSSNAGLPLASQFTVELLKTAGLNKNGPSRAQVAFLRQFVDRTFGEGSRRSAKEWPELEDVLTIIDLSANSGHHLGKDYSASQLRTVRRAILVRMIRMLEQRYSAGEKAADANWQQLDTFFKRFDASDCAVLSMNWDTVIERGLERTQKLTRFDYGCEARPAQFDGDKLKRRTLRSAKELRLIKPHGSINWLYCDACRETFWVPPDEAEDVARTLFGTRDWELLREAELISKIPKTRDPACLHCASRAIGTRFATFSYRKALDFPMHTASWRSAEGDLKQALHWVFIGYSMPGADYEFKQLLKRVQLGEPIRPTITLITAGSGARETVQRFEKFFGKVDKERFYFEHGLDGPALAHLTSIGVLRA